MVEILQADLHSKKHGDDYVRLLNSYALDVMGGEVELDSTVRDNLATEIAHREFITVFLAYENNQAIGLITCMLGFSTFRCRPLLNIHDVYVTNNYRGQGVANKLLQSAEQLARQNNCCKLTLEVLQGNIIAKKAYQNFGFKSYELTPEIGSAMFWEKPLQ